MRVEGSGFRVWAFDHGKVVGNEGHQEPDFVFPAQYFVFQFSFCDFFFGCEVQDFRIRVYIVCLGPRVQGCRIRVGLPVYAGELNVNFLLACFYYFPSGSATFGGTAHI